MSVSTFLADFWGIVIAVVSAVFLIKPKLLERFFKAAENEAAMSFLGAFTLAVGLSMVLLHNVWVLDWRIGITIWGWLTLIKGLDILFFPNRMRERWPKMKNWIWRLIFTLLFLGGLAFTYLGFAA